ncbi:hypothetical protein [Furfurilactobacillus rossiae]|uniref:Uncharacterized protein n=1 Tax=Furfurilactobacillus rossiae DSM 15814 TaxID=1114972 RepID=A0A0R1RJC6_9LACO|nr:hypothetical protein [Furfurilactobacillus rossiae]KRL56822.1 hypothetical protein FD35_GL001115 [Furfurilactobacillus rossiae DSM 15814]
MPVVLWLLVFLGLAKIFSVSFVFVLGWASIVLAIFLVVKICAILFFKRRLY